MLKILAFMSIVSATFAFACEADVAQTKKPTPNKPTHQQAYEYCKKMIKRDFGSIARVHHVVVSPSGKVQCWYYG